MFPKALQPKNLTPGVKTFETKLYQCDTIVARSPLFHHSY